MLAFLKKIFGADHESVPGVFRLEVAPDWTPDDAMILAKFLSTPTGQALGARLRAMVAAVCIGGCQRDTNTIHAAGIGAGWDECVRKFFEHAKVISPVPGVQGTNQREESAAETDLLDRFSA